MAENPNVSVCIFFGYNKDGRRIERQVRFEGIAEKLSKEKCREYYDRDTVYAKIRNTICDQGNKVDWDDLKTKHDELFRKYKEGQNQLEMPDHVLAYMIRPHKFDFYYAHDHYIADRIVFCKNKNDRILHCLENTFSASNFIPFHTIKWSLLSLFLKVRLQGKANELSKEDCESIYQNLPTYCKIRDIICEQGKEVVWEDLKKRHDELLKKYQQGMELKMPETLLVNDVTYFYECIDDEELQSMELKLNGFRM
nr:unnamed protein product [Callosobruchus analis]